MTDFIIHLFLSFAVGFFAGATVNGWRLESSLKKIENTYEEALNAAQKATTESLLRAIKAERRGETLAQERLALEAANETLLEEKRHALRKATMGRACLDAGALRLLDGTAASPGGRPGLRPPAGGAFGPDAAAHADPGDASASDTDVALWAAYAQGEYERCRGRIDTLRTYFEEKE
jgi:hypothetical protein